MKTKMDMYGVGVSLRPEISPYLNEIWEMVDCFEILFDDSGMANESIGLDKVNYLSKPTFIHSTLLSLGSTDNLFSESVAYEIKKKCNDYNVVFISDHCSFTQTMKYDVSNFLPIGMTNDFSLEMANRIRRVSTVIGLPLAIENVAHFFNNPISTMNEEQFIKNITELSGCGMLLDVNNLYINSVNHKYDPYLYIDNIANIPIHYIHIAGHTDFEGMLYDSHETSVCAEVWRLLDYALEVTNAQAVILERDNYTASIENIKMDLTLAKKIWLKHRT
ncbi:MAG: hypothetical protein RL571_1675 [Pseudomonadota bacterium]|jgi:uncharacterized protein (UPF0276 family)